MKCPSCQNEIPDASIYCPACGQKLGHESVYTNAAPLDINKRSIAMAILLTVITFGIYGIYWQYLLVKNIRAIKGEYGSCLGEMLCLIFVPFYSYYWWYTRGENVKEEFAKRGYSATGSGLLYIVLEFFGLGIVSAAIMQNDFNSLPTYF